MGRRLADDRFAGFSPLLVTFTVTRTRTCITICCRRLVRAPNDRISLVTQLGAVRAGDHTFIGGLGCVRMGPHMDNSDARNPHSYTVEWRISLPYPVALAPQPSHTDDRPRRSSSDHPIPSLPSLSKPYTQKYGLWCEVTTHDTMSGDLHRAVLR